MERHETRRQEILKAALDLFAEQGYAATGMRAIAQAVNVKESTLYHYFPGGKVALLEGLLSDYGGLRAPVAFVARIPRNLSLRDTLYWAGHGFLEGVRSLEAHKLFQVLLVEAHHDPTWTRRYLDNLTGPTLAALAEVIATKLPPDAPIEPLWVAKMFTGALISFVLHDEGMQRGGAAAPERDVFLAATADVVAAGVNALATKAF